MFEVGKKVICIKNHSMGTVKKGQVWELLAIRKGHCTAPLLFNVGIADNRNGDIVRCSKCGATRPQDNIWWLNSTLFAPYDDSLSELTAEDILEETHLHTAEQA